MSRSRARPLLVGLYTCYDLVVYRDYLLRGDEPAFVSATLGSPASWFTRGYLDYFNIHPEWGTQHSSPLLKPVANAVGYLTYALFGSRYALHFATFFLIQFLGLLVFVRLLRDLAIPPLPTAVMALLFLFNPDFIPASRSGLHRHGVTALPSRRVPWGMCEPSAQETAHRIRTLECQVRGAMRGAFAPGLVPRVTLADRHGRPLGQ